MPNKVFRLVIDVDARKAKTGAAETTTAFNKLNQAVQQYGKYAVAAGVAAAAMFARKSIQAAIVQAQAVAQVDAAIRSTGAAAGFATEELEKMASALQRQTTVGDEAILKMQSLLLTFKSVKGEQFERATEAIVDMSARMGSLESNALLLGKALDDPARRASELSRSGIVLTQTQIALVKQLEATGQRAKAQGIILDEVATQFGGAAKAAADAAGGGIQQFKNAAGDLTEVLGSKLVPALDALGKRFAAVAGSSEFNTFIDLLFRGYRAAVNFATGLDDARQKMDQFAKSPFVQAVIAVYKALTDVDGQLVKFSFDTYNASQVSTGLGDSLDSVSRELLDEEKALIQVQDALEAHRDALEQIEEQYRADIQAIRDFYAEQAQLESMLDSTIGMIDEGFGETAAGDFMDTIDDMIAAYDDAVMGRMVPATKAATDKMFEIWKNFARGVQREFADTITEMLDGNIRSFEDFFDSVFDLFKRMIAEMIAYAIANKIFLGVGFGSSMAGMAAAGGIGGAVAGGLGALGAGYAAGMGGTAALAGGWMSSMGMMLAAATPVLAVAAAAVLLKMNKDRQDAKRTVGTLEFGPGAGYTGSGLSSVQEQLHAAYQQTFDFFKQMEQLTGGTLELTQRMRLNVKGHGKVWLAIFDELGNFISEKQFDSFEDALKAGTEQLLSSADLSGASEAFAEVLSMAVQDGLERTMEKLNFLASFEDQLASATGVITPATDATLQAIQQLKDGIWALGLSAAETAKLMEKARAAEADRNKELRAGALSNLADMLERAGIRQMEADRFRAQVEQQLFQLQLKKLEAEFRALDMWNDLLENIFADLNQFAKSIGNFTIKIGEVTEDLSGVVDSTGDWLDNWKKVQAQFQDFADSVLLSGFQLRYRQILSTIKDWEERLRAAGAGASQDLRDYLKDVLKPALIKKAWQQFLQPLIDFQEQAKAGALSTSSLQEKYAGSRAKFFDLVERARAGDQDAIQALAGASQDYLQLAQQMFGTTDAYKRIFDEVMSLIDGILSDDDLMRKVIDQQHEEMMMLLELNGTTANELAQMQVDELVLIRRELQQQTTILWDQNSVMERLEAA